MGGFGEREWKEEKMSYCNIKGKEINKPHILASV